MNRKQASHDIDTLQQLALRIATPLQVKAVESAIAAGGSASRLIRLSGLAGSAPALLFSRLKKLSKPYIVIADDVETAGYIYHDLTRLCPDPEQSVKFFPSGYRRDIRYGQTDAPAQILRAEALHALDEPATRFIVTMPEALAEKVPQRSNVERDSLTLRLHEHHQLKQVRQRLLELGFQATDYVYEPGQFAIRGSILDVYSYACPAPYRIDFFDTEIDSIRNFNIETQLSTETPAEVTIMPQLDAHSAAGGVSLLEYVAADTVVLAQNCGWIADRLRDIGNKQMASEVEITGDGDPHALDNVVSPQSIISSLQQLKVVEYGLPAHDPQADATSLIAFHTEPQAPFHKNFDLIADTFSSYLKKGYTLFLLTDSEAQAERLKAILDQKTATCGPLPFTAISPTLHAGFIDHNSRSCIFTDHQIFDRFHRYNLRSEQARGGKLALSLKELQKLEQGDYVVHADHGIGRFGGLVRTDVAGKTQEMIKLYYQNDDIIFVNIHSLHKLSKYRGSEGVPPKLSRLGSGAWQKLKERTKSKVKDIARDLIRLYAARQQEKGFAFSPDSYLQHELEASFIYEDTPDQLRACQAIKADMESPRPMDRLVCGDVGFGKTELAVRAAFKAAVDGKQTALLVPTTVLALQHYHTFSERLKEMPVRVDFLSRARKPKEVKQILADLKEGKIDILIGTHKLIGKNVAFKDLGLLIIDEEQKFGVAVKEKLKQMRVNVDTLTLSATPIPRTLQFSLMGARDLSNLDTPPANRRPVATAVIPLADDSVKDAVEFELARGGQLFFITPRIERLDVLENMLHRLVPDARIVRAHGQMPPDKVEKAIIDFAARDFDILLSTTIVENGIDMPNVNTIIIDQAQHFGLSELHQLRGRVGRSDRKAFAYLTIPAGMPLTPVARRRLQTIESYSGLGAGIQIAMQDLDIRGAGNLLGAEQSGFIADLGFEVYQRILKEAVVELRTEEFADNFSDVTDASAGAEFVAETSVETDMELLIPPTYVPQEAERISLYRRLDAMDSLQLADDFRAMLRDRFGPIPYPTEQLIDIVPLRSTARSLGIERLHLKGDKMYLYFPDAANTAYYRSTAFGRFISYFQTEPHRSHLRDVKGRRSMLIDNVLSVSEALSIIRTIASLSAS